MDETDSQSISFSLLKVVLQRRFLLPELYDLMNTVTRSIVIHSVPAIQSQCRNLFLYFLLHYPLDEKRVRKYLDFFVSNLGYEYRDGRESVLEVIYQVVRQFPLEELEKHSFFLFVSLCLRVVNEREEREREEVREIVRCLLARMREKVFGEMVGMVLKWSSSSFGGGEERGEREREDEGGEGSDGEREEREEGEKKGENRALSGKGRVGLIILALVVEVSGSAYHLSSSSSSSSLSSSLSSSSVDPSTLLPNSSSFTRYLRNGLLFFLKQFFSFFFFFFSFSFSFFSSSSLIKQKQNRRNNQITTTLRSFLANN